MDRASQYARKFEYISSCLRELMEAAAGALGRGT